MGKKYRWLTRREADTLVEAGAPVEWRYNIDIYDIRPSENRMHEWRSWNYYREFYFPTEGYDDQFRVEVE